MTVSQMEGEKASKMALTDCATSYFTINTLISSLLEIYPNILLKYCKNVAACWLQD